MRLYRLPLIFTMACFFQFGFTAYTAAQVQKTTVTQGVMLRVEMKDGNVIVGRRLAMTEDDLILDTPAYGKLSIPLDDIREIREIPERDVVGGNYWHYNYAANQNFVSPNAFGLRKNEWQYHNFMLAFNQLSYGITDKLSIHAATELISPIVSFSEQEFGGPGYMIRPHYTFTVHPEKVAIGAGVTLIGVPFSEKFMDVAAPYVVVNLGNRNTYANISAGWAFGKRDNFFFFEPQRSSPLMLSAGGTVRLSKLVSLTTENWLWSNTFENLFMNTLGVALSGERVTWRIGLVGFGDSFGYFVAPIPVASLTARL
ncbi:MAG: hypothetical protein KF852_13715 [Saprospiraceae bacterium]|nr:hypothetical protein [Saprospiraceae bacterium]